MKTPIMRTLFILIAAGAALYSLDQGHGRYLPLIAVAAFILAAFIQQGSDDTRILILASGEILVIAVAAASLWVSFIVQCAVIGAILFDGRVLSDTRDLTFFGLYCIVALTCTIILDRSNQVLLPFLTVTAIVGATTVMLVKVQEMQERRMYAGGK
jgi:hypothetical protein